MPLNKHVCLLLNKYVAVCPLKKYYIKYCTEDLGFGCEIKRGYKHEKRGTE